MKFINRLLFIIISLLLPIIAGCIQGQATVSLNPDGSGKVIIETVMDPCGIATSAGMWESYRNYLAQIKESLLGSEGIDAWSNVEWKVLPSGKYYFKGEAYFKSINDVAIHLGKIKCKLKAYMVEDANGEKAVEIHSLKLATNDEKLKRQNSAERFKLFAPDMISMMDGLRMDVVFVLPTKTDKVEGFSEIDKRTVHFLLDGRRMQYLLEYIDQNELYELAEKWNYNRVEFLNNELLPMYLDSLPLKVTLFSEGENLFDYDKEKSAAKNDIVAITDKIDGEMAEAKIYQQKESPTTKGEKEVEEQPVKDIESQLRTALILEARDQYQKAIVVYLKIIDTNGIDVKYLAQAYFKSGVCFFEMGENEKALSQFDYVIVNFPKERIPAARSAKMIHDIKEGTIVRKADRKVLGPTIIDSSPGLYVQDVNYAVDSISINFSQAMDKENWYYSSFLPGKMPKITGVPAFDSDGKRWTLPVQLEPNEVYAIGFNCGDAVKDNSKQKPGFRNVSGKYCKPFVLVFSTIKDNNEPTEIGQGLVERSQEINITN